MGVCVCCVGAWVESEVLRRRKRRLQRRGGRRSVSVLPLGRQLQVCGSRSGRHALRGGVETRWIGNLTPSRPRAARAVCAFNARRPAPRSVCRGPHATKRPPAHTPAQTTHLRRALRGEHCPHVEADRPRRRRRARGGGATRHHHRSAGLATNASRRGVLLRRRLGAADAAVRHERHDRVALVVFRAR